jgi:DNA-binding NarL/FixJ family response regulator
MKSTIDRAKALQRLINEPPRKKLSEAARVVAEQRSLIRRAIRRGHSLSAVASALSLPKRTLQTHLNLAGLFFRKPRKNKGVVIRPYKRREKAP